MKTFKKVWGREDWIVNNELYCFKILHLKKGYQCSTHCHKIKDETFIIQSGKIIMEHGDVGFPMYANDLVRIKPNEYHRFIGIEDSVIVEISTQHIEEDSYRISESGKVNK